MSTTKRRTLNIDANAAVSYVAHSLTEVIAIYPITPSSSMSEDADARSAAGNKNIWGSVPRVVEMQSEAGAAGAVHGALQAGALSTTFTSSQGLLLMLPNMFKIAGELTPAVFHVASRAIATHALSIFGDHQDVMAARQVGWAMLNSSNPQEAMDMALIAHSSTLINRIPVIHFFDGFRTSHEIQKVEELSHDDMRAMIDDSAVRRHRAAGLRPENPHVVGTAQNPDIYFAGRERANVVYDAMADVMQTEMDKFEKITGRKYGVVEYHGAPDAEDIVVIMGSAFDLFKEVVDELNAVHGYKVGVLLVRLYRPFPMEAFLKAVPKSVKRISVMDRTKESGSVGEPLFLDVVSAYNRAREYDEFANLQTPYIIGGRYGLGSHNFLPSMVKAVYDNLAASKPKSSFTVGIHDDVGHTSIDYDKNWDISNESSYSAMFYGFGSDGTVSANKSTAKIVGENTDKFIQAYFSYDSKKAGGVTISHLRFSDKPIRRPYLITRADFVACHKFEYLELYDMLKNIKDNGTFLLNSEYDAATVWNHLPQTVRRQIVSKNLKFYVIDAVGIGRDIGLKRRYNLVLQTAYFKLASKGLGFEFEKSVEYMKDMARKAYGKFGDKVVDMNMQAVDQGRDRLEEVDYTLNKSQADLEQHAEIAFALNAHASGSDDKFIRETTAYLVSERGEELAMSALPLDGKYPTGTSKLEKRDIAMQIPIWDEELCIQCGDCSFICPHAAIRTKAYSNDELEGAPSKFKSLKAKGKGFDNMSYTVQVSPLDCTGCNLCIEACPVTSKTDPTRKAINMASPIEHKEEETENFDFFLTLSEPPAELINLASVKGSQLKTPLFEFASGACAGCGETPYVKLLTQLFGDRLMIANATGCSSIYGGNLPTSPYTCNSEGYGPSWGNSLFEDNAEFGFGMKITVDTMGKDALRCLHALRSSIGNDELCDAIANAKQDSSDDIAQQRKRVSELRTILEKLNTEEATNLLSLTDFLVRKSFWMLGGDGWAYDIGYGGLDHIFSTSENFNVLVMDTEVYSNTGGQASKSTPFGATAKFAADGKVSFKKNLGMMMMTYGHVYVAYVSLANSTQLLKAMLEAEAYDGPSLIIAYSTCIEHGIDMSKGVEHQKVAIETGYWPLFRFDPRLIGSKKSPLQLDSRLGKKHVSEFFAMENRFRTTAKKHKDSFDALTDVADKHYKDRFQYLKDLSALYKAQGESADSPEGK